MSRSRAMKSVKGSVAHEMRELGVIVRASGDRTLKEEIPEAYKDVAHVVEVVERAGISKKVARLKPLGVIKG
jgi:tRNA-splicing ligase RtcB